MAPARPGGRVLLLLWAAARLCWGRTDTWYNDYGSDIRQTVGIASSTSQISMFRCVQHCAIFAKCYAVNYNRQTQECETLQLTRGRNPVPSPTPASGWKHLAAMSYLDDPCSYDPCEPASVCLTYSRRPGDPVRTRRRLYTCSSHWYLINKRAQGHTNCSFSQLINVDFGSYDVVGWDPKTMYYADMMNHCNGAYYTCLGLISKAVDSQQWFKTETHLTQTWKTPTFEKGTVFFVGDCN
ncbi:uncharacterized protein LOC108667903 [Hyalella azteca]|uniref:Uncharacterized protein LOC108667903 n=1 Tax=Hyalella azteca TaxID=294128 RepID=A0A8B7NA85_HYAAZ|nr:uncharacterized protein LOC108667903 [Hyalella azteca]